MDKQEVTVLVLALVMFVFLILWIGWCYNAGYDYTKIDIDPKFFRPPIYPDRIFLQRDIEPDEE